MDILCQAKSGMGKTAVFVLATLQQLEPVDGQVCLSVCLSVSLLVCGELASLSQVVKFNQLDHQKFYPVYESI